MLRKRLKKAGRDQRGITGLETAIVLIAFVVVCLLWWRSHKLHRSDG
jgi:flagellin-like protein